jgi:hypothetical protein
VEARGRTHRSHADHDDIKGVAHSPCVKSDAALARSPADNAGRPDKPT